MKAIVVHAYGGPEVLRYEDAPEPVPGPGEVLVAVRAVGVNFADVTSRLGRYRPKLPWIPGVEAAGEVIRLGADVTEVRVGDRVAWAEPPAGLPLRPMGRWVPGQPLVDSYPRTYAERAVVPAWRTVPVPDGVDDPTAAAVMLQGVTAHYLAYAAAPVRAGHRVLVHAGAGGVGLLLTQMAKALGATVYTTVSSDAKARESAEAGADGVVVYTRENFRDRILEWTDGEGVDVVYDSVGAATFDGSLECLRPRGHLVLYGQASGPVPPLDLTRLHTGSYSVTRPSLAHYTASREELLERGRAVLEGVAKGTLRVRIHRVYPLQEAARAHAELEGRQTVGKIVLVP
ncbi:MAG: quinone oxidoreductase [Actinomycetia bacterium]|nr:quinone oxidoreductase [Actinomycetes bacterium]